MSAQRFQPSDAKKKAAATTAETPPAVKPEPTAPPAPEAKEPEREQSFDEYLESDDI